MEFRLWGGGNREIGSNVDGTRFNAGNEAISGWAFDDWTPFQLVFQWNCEEFRIYLENEAIGALR